VRERSAWEWGTAGRGGDVRSEVVVAFRAKFGNSLWCIASGMTNHITKKLQDPWRNNLVVPHFHCLVNVCIMLAFRSLFFSPEKLSKEPSGPNSKRTAVPLYCTNKKNRPRDHFLIVPVQFTDASAR